jgi:hypothetical protein
VVTISVTPAAFASIASSKQPAAAHPALLSRRNDGLVTELCGIKVFLTERKPDDDFGGSLRVGVGPQIELGNCAVESLQEGRNGFRVEGSAFV